MRYGGTPAQTLTELLALRAQIEFGLACLRSGSEDGADYCSTLFTPEKYMSEMVTVDGVAYSKMAVVRNTSFETSTRDEILEDMCGDCFFQYNRFVGRHDDNSELLKELQLVRLQCSAFVCVA